MVAIDRAQVAARWAEAGYDCELWVDPPGQVWADFVHPTDEMVCVVAGVITIESGGVVHRLAAGQECHIPAGEHHTVINVGGTTARWLYGYRLAS